MRILGGSWVFLFLAVKIFFFSASFIMASWYNMYHVVSFFYLLLSRLCAGFVRSGFLFCLGLPGFLHIGFGYFITNGRLFGCWASRFSLRVGTYTTRRIVLITILLLWASWFVCPWLFSRLASGIPGISGFLALCLFSAY